MTKATVVALGMIASLAIPSSGALAFNFGDSWGKLVDSAADVLTLGQHGRNRDKERAEAQRQASEAARAKEEEKLKLQISMLTDDVKLLRDVSQTFHSNQKALKEVVELQREITKAAQDEVTNREASFRLIETVRDWLREDNQALQETVTAIDSLSFVDNQSVTGAMGPKASDSIEQIKKIHDSQEAAANAIKNQLESIRIANLSESDYLKEAVAKLKTENLREIIVKASSSSAKLANIGQSLDSAYSTYRNILSSQLSKLALLSNVSRESLSTEYETGLPEVTFTQTTISTTTITNTDKAYSTAVGIVAPETSQPAKICLSFNDICFSAANR